jgi:uncharacterized membrane protein HdeD (DUF308 family)
VANQQQANAAIMSKAESPDTYASESDWPFPAEALQTRAMNAVLSRNWWVVLLRGSAAILFGLVTLFWPGITMLSLVAVFVAYALVDGAFAIASAVRAARRHERWGLLVLNGIVSIAAGVVALLWPGITVLAFVMLIAAYAILSGAFMFVSAFRLNVDHGRVWLALGGLASLAFGILLVLAPLAGAVVLTWWIGAYALIFGCFLLILAFRLRAKKDESSTQHA